LLALADSKTTKLKKRVIYKIRNYASTLFIIKLNH